MRSDISKYNLNTPGKIIIWDLPRAETFFSLFLRQVDPPAVMTKRPKRPHKEDAMRPAQMNINTLAEYFLTPEHSGESFHRSAMTQLVPPSRVAMAAAKVSLGIVVGMCIATMLSFLQ